MLNSGRPRFMSQICFIVLPLHKLPSPDRWPPNTNNISINFWLLSPSRPLIGSFYNSRRFCPLYGPCSKTDLIYRREFRSEDSCWFCPKWLTLGPVFAQNQRNLGCDRLVSSAHSRVPQPRARCPTREITLSGSSLAPKTKRTICGTSLRSEHRALRVFIYVIIMALLYFGES